MDSDKLNGKSIWIIKDQNGNIAHRNSIGKIKHGWIYIAYKTFSEDCRGYITKEQAEKALLKLNKMRLIAGLDYDFHIELHNLNKIIQEHKLFRGENLVICEKMLLSNSLTKII